MSHLRSFLSRSTFPLLLVACLAALSFSYAFADSSRRPLAVAVIGDPDAAVNGKFAVGSSSVGSKALTVTGVIDFLGAGTVHNYFTQGAGNNMQINTNVDEANTVGDASKSQWKLVLGSSLDWFSIRRSPAGGTYNEDALFFIQGSTGNVGIATVDTGNNAAIPFAFNAKLHVLTTSGHAVYGYTTAKSGPAAGVYGRSDSPAGYGVTGWAAAATGSNYGVLGESDSDSGYGVFGIATATSGLTFGVYGESVSTAGSGVYGMATPGSGLTSGVHGESASTEGYGVSGHATATTGTNSGVYGRSSSASGYGVWGYASATTGTTHGVYGLSTSTSGAGVYGNTTASSGTNYGVFGVTNSTQGRGVYGYAAAWSGTTYGVLGAANSSDGYGVYAIGDLGASGTKSAIVDTQGYGWRTLYTIESPQNWFEDFGQATLLAGEVVVPIEEIFAQTVDLSNDYHVFLTPLGDCPLFVAEKSASSFTVRAHDGASCDIAFDYRIIAPRLGYEDLRLKEAQDPQEVAAAMPEVLAAP
jgi:hypothetical protein